MKNNYRTVGHLIQWGIYMLCAIQRPTLNSPVLTKRNLLLADLFCLRGELHLMAVGRVVALEFFEMK
jgi:hypothetical protein